MRYLIKEYGYLAVMCVCLVWCAVLLASVTTDRPLVAIAQTHIPVLRTQTEREHGQTVITPENGSQETLSGTQTGFLLTEEELEGKLADFLPDTFPASDIDVSLEDGLLKLDFSMGRSALKAYLKAQGADLGTRQDLLFQMLPRKLEAEATFALSADRNGLHLQPVTLELGDKVFDLSALPQSVFSAVDEGINALLKSNGVTFSAVEVTEEGLLLK